MIERVLLRMRGALPVWLEASRPRPSLEAEAEEAEEAEEEEDEEDEKEDEEEDGNIGHACWSLSALNPFQEGHASTDAG